jgi:hypothetical protein
VEETPFSAPCVMKYESEIAEPYPKVDFLSRVFNLS